MTAIGPSPIVNVPVLSEDGVWNFSNQQDVVVLGDFPASYGEPIRMWDGDDIVLAIVPTDSTGFWNNIVNGNRGNDEIRGGIEFTGVAMSSSYLIRNRSYFRGGKGDDLLLGWEGADWVNGNEGDDYVRGGDSDVRSIGNGPDIVRGGKGDDVVQGGTGYDILIGDFGTDRLSTWSTNTIGYGNNRFILRTDSAMIDGTFYNNVSNDPSEVDWIVAFSGNDKIVIPGVESFDQLKFLNAYHNQREGTVLIDVDPALHNVALIAADLDADGRDEYIGYLSFWNASTINNPAYFVVGQEAQDFYDGISVDSFLQNPNYWATV